MSIAPYGMDSVAIGGRDNRRVLDLRGFPNRRRKREYIRLKDMAWAAVGMKTKARVYAGYLIVDGRGMWRWPDASSASSDITVTGNGWIIGKTTRNSPGVPTVQFQAAAPNPASTTEFQFPICEVEYDATSTAVWVTKRWQLGSSVIFGAV